jgi:hypothetical protein
MNTQNLIASIAAVVLTTITMGVIGQQMSRPGKPAEASRAKVTEMAPVTVKPSAADLRAAALMVDGGIAATATTATLPSLGQIGEGSHFSLIQSQLAMPYYSFGNKFGRISKE